MFPLHVANIIAFRTTLPTPPFPLPIVLDDCFINILSALTLTPVLRRERGFFQYKLQVVFYVLPFPPHFSPAPMVPCPPSPARLGSFPPFPKVSFFLRRITRQQFQFLTPELRSMAPSHLSFHHHSFSFNDGSVLFFLPPFVMNFHLLYTIADRPIVLF